MKVLSSLKSAKARHRDCKVVRRRGKVFVICKSNPRFKARQRLFHGRPQGAPPLSALCVRVERPQKCGLFCVDACSHCLAIAGVG